MIKKGEQFTCRWCGVTLTANCDSTPGGYEDSCGAHTGQEIAAIVEGWRMDPNRVPTERASQ